MARGREGVKIIICGSRPTERIAAFQAVVLDVWAYFTGSKE